MFHAHVAEFTELGWMAAFDVRSGATASIEDPRDV